jgi:hypothetical protein
LERWSDGLAGTATTRSDLQTEGHHFAEANHHVAQGEQRIDGQQVLVEKLRDCDVTVG